MEMGASQKRYELELETNLRKDWSFTTAFKLSVLNVKVLGEGPSGDLLCDCET